MVIGLPLWVVRFWPVILLDIAWEAVWKGVALWRAGRNAHMVWFICLFIFNTLGILPIIYIFAFSEKEKKR
jgi:hypothetical protein